MTQQPSRLSPDPVDRLFRELEVPIAREVMWHSYSRLCNGIAKAQLRMPR